MGKIAIWQLDEESFLTFCVLKNDTNISFASFIIFSGIFEWFADIGLFVSWKYDIGRSRCKLYSSFANRVSGKGSTIGLEFSLRGRVHRCRWTWQYSGLFGCGPRQAIAQCNELFSSITRRCRSSRQSFCHASWCHSWISRWVENFFSLLNSFHRFFYLKFIFFICKLFICSLNHKCKIVLYFQLMLEKIYHIF